MPKLIKNTIIITVAVIATLFVGFIALIFLFGDDSNVEKVSIERSSETAQAESEEKKEIQQVPFGDFVVNDGFKIKVNQVEYLDQVVVIDSLGDELKYTPRNKALVVTLEGHNEGNEVAYYELYKNRLKLGENQYAEVDDWNMYEFTQPTEDELPQGYRDCISCFSKSLNPGDKAIERIIYDVPEMDLTGAKILFEDFDLLLN